MKQPDTSGAAITAVDSPETGPGSFLVTGTLGFDSVPGLMNQALRLFVPFDSLVVDFSGVDDCNSAGLAIILELARLMRQQNKTICFKSIPEDIHTFARAYSIEKEFSQSGLLC